MKYFSTIHIYDIKIGDEMTSEKGVIWHLMSVQVFLLDLESIRYFSLFRWHHNEDNLLNFFRQ